jgi:hypothetical protein
MLGYAVNRDLPLLAPAIRLRDVREVVDRMLVLEVLTASVVIGGCSAAKATLEQVNLLHACVGSELVYLDMDEAEAPYGWFDLGEGQWALGWAVSLVRELDFSRGAGAALSVYLPEEFDDLEARERLRARCKFRPAAKIFEALDFAYCLYQAVARARLGGPPIPDHFWDHVVTQRYRALAWLAGVGGWDDVVPEASQWPPQRGRKPVRTR